MDTPPKFLDRKKYIHLVNLQQSGMKVLDRTGNNCLEKSTLNIW